MAFSIIHEDSRPPALAILAVASIVAYVGLAIYRITLHPLARFPGPRLAAITKWYEAYFDIFYKGGSQYTSKIREMHDRYGPIVRINPDEVSVRDADFHDRLYAPPRSEIRHRHPHFSTTLGTTKGSFSTVDHKLHKSRRTAYSPFWGSANVMAAEPLIMGMVNDLCKHVAGMQEGSGTSLRTLFAATSFDTFYTWAFGSSLGLLDNLKLAYDINEAVEIGVTSPPLHRIFPSMMPIARLIPSKILRYASSHLNNVMGLHSMIVKASEEWIAAYSGQSDEKQLIGHSKPQPRTLFDVLRNSNAPEEEKTASRMAQEGIEMFMAAYTPGRTSMLAMHYLHAHPHVLERIRNELDQVNPDPAMDLTFAKLNSLPYLRATMKEILRITFPVGARLPFLCAEDLEFQGWRIPANTGVSVNHRILLFDPDVFKNPYEFNPERWLDASHPIDEKRYYIPFGKGARSCPSKEFATQFIQLIVATLIQRFDFNMDDAIWERDVAAASESVLTSPSTESKGLKIYPVGQRY
ncbi:cytochrome P450 [Stachybotrys elegans]|uniref:Cytochrome P450 n=1 Tax=Stachybotrys elegans TaxID=80388 RepID=A0A8K0T266_9HYPO|nr:cytochrome P450 [Stachybotrys elegans]